MKLVSIFKNVFKTFRIQRKVQFISLPNPFGSNYFSFFLNNYHENLMVVKEVRNELTELWDKQNLTSSVVDINYI